jgi:predicted Zn-dependent protease
LEGLAVAYAAMGQQQRAIELMNAELKRTSNPNPIHAMFGRMALLMKKPDLAIEQYTALTRDEPKAARNHYMLAEALRAKGDSPAAIARRRATCRC